jgi:putative acetyltransferase
MSIQLLNPTDEHFELIDDLIEAAFDRKTEAELVRKLRLNSNVYDPLLEYLILSNNTPVAHILYTHNRIIQGDFVHSVLVMAPVSVHPAFQRQGIGTRIITETLQDLADRNYEAVLVLGHAGFYPRFGFQSSTLWQIEAPFPVPEDAFMALELRPGSLSNKSGVLQYAEEFYSTVA